MPLPEAFDYAEPEGMDLVVGEQVAVPLGPNLMRGVVVALRDAMGGNRPLKPVAERLDDPALPAGVLEFVQWAARYAVDTPGAPLAIALRGARAPKARPVRVVEPTGADTQVFTKIAGVEVTSVFRERHDFKPGAMIRLKPDPTRAHLFDAASGVRLVA